MATEMQNTAQETPSQFERLLAAGASMPPRQRVAEIFASQIDSNLAVPGQIWSTVPSSNLEEKSLTHWVLVLGRHLINGSAVLRVAPMFTDTVMADHQDAILPREILGFEAAFAFGLTVSTSTHMLNRCVLELSQDWKTRLLDFQQFVAGLAETRPAGLESSIPYVDQMDSRIEFHSDLLSELDYLQHSMGEFVTESHPNIVSVAFWNTWEDARSQNIRLAAASGGDNQNKTFSAQYRVVALDIFIDLRAFRDSPEVHVSVWDSSGSPSKMLDGYRLVGADRGQLCKLESGEGTFSGSDCTGEIGLIDLEEKFVQVVCSEPHAPKPDVSASQQVIMEPPANVVEPNFWSAKSDFPAPELGQKRFKLAADASQVFLKGEKSNEENSINLRTAVFTVIVIIVIFAGALYLFHWMKVQRAISQLKVSVPEVLTR